MREREILLDLADRVAGIVMRGRPVADKALLPAAFRALANVAASELIRGDDEARARAGAYIRLATFLLDAEKLRERPPSASPSAKRKAAMN